MYPFGNPRGRAGSQAHPHTAHRHTLTSDITHIQTKRENERGGGTGEERERESECLRFGSCRVEICASSRYGHGPQEQQHGEEPGARDDERTAAATPRFWPMSGCV